jgi:hypothetical protein
MRYRLRMLLIVLALAPAFIALLMQLHWYRSVVRYGGGVPSENDPAIKEEIDRAMKFDPGTEDLGYP